ncbi:hypothetical protein R50073_09790 [Maricurvus nonylphenolicus]|uniref:hypothetical protein n=1 Tax=Maricurvus nonylphenolicus TaxID=1008307 RepID=UPI0036F1C415
MSEKYVAIRLKSIHHGEERFSAKGCTIINSRMEKREPALKNITDALFDLGLDYEIDKHSLVWFLIDDDQSAEEHLCYVDIEVAFEACWYEAEKARIRGYTGIHYYDACVELAKGFTLKDQTRLISDAKVEKAPEPEVVAGQEQEPQAQEAQLPEPQAQETQTPEPQAQEAQTPEPQAQESQTPEPQAESQQDVQPEAQPEAVQLAAELRTEFQLDIEHQIEASKKAAVVKLETKKSAPRTKRVPSQAAEAQLELF